MNQPTWDRHRWLEDNANTVYVLARELVDVPGQVPAEEPHPEMLLFNHAHYTPPAGAPAAPGTRRFHRGSIVDRGLQIYVNYSSVPIGTTGGAYFPGTFFVSLAPVSAEDQADPPVPHLLSGIDVELLSATHAAFGTNLYDAPHSTLPRYVRTADDAITEPCSLLLYVAAGVDYAIADFHQDDQGDAGLAQTDRLLAWDGAAWSELALPAAAAQGNTGAVALADLDGDAVVDAYVGKSGDAWAGAEDHLLTGSLAGPGACDPCAPTPDCDLTLQVTPGRLPTPGGQPLAVATSDVEVADLDLDGDLDLVVVGRARWEGTPAAESHDHVLLNDGAGDFSQGLLWLDRTGSDSRSVAMGNVDAAAGVGLPEIVIGNAGAGEFSTDLVLPQSEAANQRLDIFEVTGWATPGGGGPGVPIYQDVRAQFLPDAVEARMTSPLTFQVQLVDLLGDPNSTSPFGADGYLDLVIVNGREHLKSEDLDPTDEGWEPNDGESTHMLGSNVQFLWNDPGTGLLVETDADMGERSPLPWIRCVSLSNFIRYKVPDVFGNPVSDGTENTLDLFLGTGNRIQGSLSYLYLNTDGLEDTLNWQDAPNTHKPWSKLLDQEQTYNYKPGGEHGYGFDFADYNDDGAMDALATSRTYNYLVESIGSFAHFNWHRDLAVNVDPNGEDLDNRRWQLYPRGMEDGVFADFDQDGLLDAVLASQKAVDVSVGGTAPETIVILGTGNQNEPFEFETTTLTFSTGTSSENVTVDAAIDVNGRTSIHHAKTADRAVACDLDNDGDVDCIVRLFSVGGGITQKLGDLVPTDAIAKMTAGWRYLVNQTEEGTPTGHLFKDEAPRRMIHYGTGQFSELYNRRLGYELIADVDNNGYADLVSIVHDTSDFVSDPYQVRNLLFLNNYSASGAGTLVDVSDKLIGGQVAMPKASIAAVFEGYEFDGSGLLVDKPHPPYDQPYDRANPQTAAHGDADNDGDTDLFMGYTANSQRTNYPSLLINKKEAVTTEEGTHFLDEYLTRVDLQTFSDLIHSPPVVGVEESSPGVWTKTTYEHMDSVWAGGFMDFDADGDNDLVYIVGDDFPRFLRNKGEDRDGDSRIDAADVALGAALGYFEDVTDDVLGAPDAWAKPNRDSQDFQVVDLDGDGDLDFATYSFGDEVTLWRNEVDLGDRPAVSEIWPRVGSVQGSTVTLHGIHMDEIVQVSLISAGAVVDLGGPSLNPIDARRLEVTIPTDAPIGLNQVQVVRRKPGGPLVAGTQYFGYFVLEAPDQ